MQEIRSVLVIGAGPIVIGQAAEFDYSGTQAVKALRSRGVRVILVNSNPATIMTDPDMAEATYIEPLTPAVLEAVLEREKPEALLPTVGGQTALNLAVDLAHRGVLERHGVRLIGASLQAMQLAEDRLLFRQAVQGAGLQVPRGAVATSPEEALDIARSLGVYPLLVRPSFTLGGSGGGVAWDEAQLRACAEFGLAQSPAGSILVEESLLGWKEFELEVMRDRAGNFVVVCPIENLDPMGVHTGDSVTVAPAMTLTDREYQRLRDQARAVMDAVGVATGGANVQFAVHPGDGRAVVIEMNPRVSRSSALASKATGVPIAKLATLLALGCTLEELRNDITGKTAAFEPSLDYVVVKIPRWNFEKFPGVDRTLGPQMKSVGEVMALGRTFKEALMKGLQSLELPHPPFPTARFRSWDGHLESLARPGANRLWCLWEALREGRAVEDLARATGIDPWFIGQLADIVALERELAGRRDLTADDLRRAKRMGLGDLHLAWLADQQPLPPSPEPSPVRAEEVRWRRRELGVEPTYHMVDTCAAEFESSTPYLYSSYQSRSEAPPTSLEKVIILGSGPNRIGQGIEFDYCCVHAALEVQAQGLEAVMVNCNPETVSTDYDTSDRLYFEPLTPEHVLAIIEREKPLRGVIVQLGGQTPLNLVEPLARQGVPLLGTSADSIHLAEDRGRFGVLVEELGIPNPAFGLAAGLEEARRVAARIGYPLMVRPSFVLGGRAMAIVYDENSLERYLREALNAAPGQPVLLDQFLEDAYEVDVDALCDGRRVVIGAIMQHIEEAGVHSGDSACVIPPYKVSAFHLAHMREYTERLGLALGVRGLMNVQYAIKDDVVYVLEVNPRASRTVPYVSKAVGLPLARLATRILLGATLDDLGLIEEPRVRGFSVKEVVLPFRKFLGVDALLGPEMRSTGEVMGLSSHFGMAFAKAQMAADSALPLEGTVFFSVNDYDKSAALKLARDLVRLGFDLVGSAGTAAFFTRAGVPTERVLRVSEGSPNVVDHIREGKIQLIINTPLGSVAHADGVAIRTAAVRYGVPLLTTLSAAQAAVHGIRALKNGGFEVRSLQEWHAAG
jgi:carbamoyl-phosphate synthase large subunit